MKNISFDNPYLLLLFLVFAAAILIPFFLAFRGRKTKNVLVSLGLHLVMSALVVLSISGMHYTSVITETNVYVVADVSYSANGNLDVVDEYIQTVKKGLPKNSKMGVVCFGKDYELVSDMGAKIKSVKSASVDNTATDIVGALNYTAGLFKEDVIKRIVLITDGKDTDVGAATKLITAIEGLYTQDIRVDAMYINDNLPEGAQEMQISRVEYMQNTYVNREMTADVFVQSSYEGKAILSLYRGEETLSDQAIEVGVGYNVFNFDLPTDQAGVFDYQLRLTPEKDETAENNTYVFTQEVTGKVKVLLIAPTQSDKTEMERVYGDKAEITAYINDMHVPYTVDQLCEYDEIVLSNTDVRKLNNATSFIDALDKAVSQFGKSLVTVGNTDIQNKANETDLSKLEDMLPVRFGNNDQDPKLFMLVVDFSRSMQMASRLLMLKEAACTFLDLLGPEDMVGVVTFAGTVNPLQSPKAVKTCREELKTKIKNEQPSQGTYLGKGMLEAYKLIKDLPYEDKQVVLISDGASYGLEADNPVEVAGQMRADNILTTVIDPRVSDEGHIEVLKNIAKAGALDGNAANYNYDNYYVIESENTIRELIFNEIADDVTESIIEGDFALTVQKQRDESMEGVFSLPNIQGYAYAKAKASATTVLTTVYERESGNIDAPVYTYWKYGNGRVSCLTTSLSGAWVEDWSTNDDATNFLKNILHTSVPTERIAHPYTLSIEHDGKYLSIEATPAVINPYGSVEVTIETPSGEKIVEKLTFDSEKYTRKFELMELGKYQIGLVYAYDGGSFATQTVRQLSYHAEHDRFVVFDPSTLYSTLRNRGTVSTDGKIKIENEKEDIATYELSFTLPFMIAAAVLFVADIIVRKLKWKDVVSFFKKKRKGGS